jgi:hypothetical protein
MGALDLYGDGRDGVVGKLKSLNLDIKIVANEMLVRVSGPVSATIKAVTEFQASSGDANGTN